MATSPKLGEASLEDVNREHATDAGSRATALRDRRASAHARVVLGRTTPAWRQRRILFVAPDTRERVRFVDHLRAGGLVVARLESLDHLSPFEANAAAIVVDASTRPKRTLEWLQCHRASRLRDANVVVIAANAGIPDAVRFIKAGAYDFLVKPLHMSTLLERVRDAARLTQAAETATTVPTLRTVEYDALSRALEDANGRVIVAARKLGLPRSTMYVRMAAYGLKPPNTP